MSMNMSERSNREERNRSGAEDDAIDAPEVAPSPTSPLSAAEMDALVEDLTIEALMQEPPQGDLSVISDEDVPGAPG
jgi:hypothetical protein